jgi:hypothetical protein
VTSADPDDLPTPDGVVDLETNYARFVELIEAAQAGQSRAGEVARADLPTVPRKALP